MLLQKAKTITTPTAYSNGFVHSVKPNVLENLLLQSNQFDTTWLNQLGGTITSGQAGYDGTNDAWLISKDTSTFRSVRQVISWSGVSTFSVYAKEGSLSNAALRIDTGGGAIQILYDLTNGSVTSTSGVYIDAGSDDIGSGWYRLYVSANVSSGTNVHIYPDRSGTTAGNIYIQDAQLNKGLTADQYIETTTETSPRADFTFTRNSSATRVGEDGYIQDVQIIGGELVQNGDFEEIGSELITNGSFDTDSDWTLIGTANISGGTANFPDNTSSFVIQTSIIPLSVKLFRIQYEITDTNGGALRLGGGSSAFGSYNLPNTLGTHIVYLASNGTQNNLQFHNNLSFIGSIDNVSVKEVGQDWTFGNGWTMGDGKAVFSDTANGDIRTQHIFTAGNKYRINLSVSDLTSGTAFFALGDGSSNNLVTYDYYANGDYTFDVTAVNGAELRIFATTTSSSSFSIDNISVKEITDDTNLPRINYEGFDYDNGLPIYGSGKGHLLLEGQSTNLVPYSEDFSQWSNSRTTDASNQAISPNGNNNASVFEQQSGQTNAGSIFLTGLGLSSGTYTQSVFAKKKDKDFIVGYNANAERTYFNLSNGTIGTVASGNIAKIEDYGNGWYRCAITYTITSGSVIAFYLADTDYSTTVTDSGGVYIWGAQLEQSDYATSYIPTNGTAVTRLADVCNNAGNSDLFDSEGVLYAEIAALADDLTYRQISLTQTSSGGDVLTLDYSSTSNQIRTYLRVGASTQSLTYTLSDETQYNKIAVRYKDTHSLWVNGLEVASQAIISSSINLNVLTFDNGSGGGDFYGKTKMVAVFPYLSNDEMECLTSEGYGSFEAMALANNYTII